ncbi:hypothetical protein AAHA92_15467 [Salvia divinorum]|uniref:Uncharacterized protein n=1 Tax=Salvia divinorum TaxID=28513 RepID=A0ABD1HHF9_SALDI
MKEVNERFWLCPSEGVSHLHQSLLQNLSKFQWERGSVRLGTKGTSHYNPITRIRKNIVVALLDVWGNEIAHQDIGTMQIIEKGSWDEAFSIHGGGHVHEKLHFTLSEEDHNCIRVMREFAMKKRLEAKPNLELRFLEVVASRRKWERKRNQLEELNRDENSRALQQQSQNPLSKQHFYRDTEVIQNPLHEKERKIRRNMKNLDHQPESGSAGSPNDSSNGVIGQALEY